MLTLGMLKAVGFIFVDEKRAQEKLTKKKINPQLSIPRPLLYP